MTDRPRGELTSEEENILGIERQTPEQEAEAEKIAAEKREVRKRFLVGLMNNELFREFLIEQLLGFNTFGNPFGVSPTGFPDREATQFQMGMKAAGWHLWELFDGIAPELSSLMRREAMEQKPKL